MGSAICYSPVLWILLSQEFAQKLRRCSQKRKKVGRVFDGSDNLAHRGAMLSPFSHPQK
jgi:hypothetical protein